MNKLTAAQWRKKVEKEMEKIPEKVWETITEHKKMDHIQEANEIMEGEGIEQGLAYLIEVVEQEMTSFERYHLPLLPKQENQEEEKGRETLSREMPPDKRFQAWSDIVAVLANNEKDIISFRQEVLNGQLLKPEEVPQWIGAVREKEGFTTGITLKFTAGDGWEERLVEHAKQVAAYAREGKFYPGTGYGEGSLLSYVKPGSEWREVISINENGILGRLKKLAKRYDAFWPEAWAVHFILTGINYPLSRARIGQRLNSYGINKITLEVSPHLSGDKVKKLYLEAKKKYFKLVKEKSKSRQLSSKHLALAVFTVKTPGSWSWKRKKWNDKYPQWKYEEKYTFNFARDCRAAYENLTGWKYCQLYCHTN